jgi:hypothetical protein
VVKTPLCLPGRNVVGCPRSAGEGKNRLRGEPGLLFTGIATVKVFGLRYPHVAVQLPSGFLTDLPSWIGMTLSRSPGSISVPVGVKVRLGVGVKVAVGAVAVGVWVGLESGAGVKVGASVGVGSGCCVKVGVAVDVAVGVFVCLGWLGFGVAVGTMATGWVVVGRGAWVSVAVWVGAGSGVFVEVGLAMGVAVLTVGRESVGFRAWVTTGARVLVGRNAALPLVGGGSSQ